MLRVLFYVFASFIVSLLAAGPAAEQVLLKSDFDSGVNGWINQVEKTQVKGATAEWLAEGGREGSGCLHIRGLGASPGILIWRYELKDIPKGKEWRFKGYVKGDNVETVAAICVQGHDNEGENRPDFSTTALVKSLRGTFDWTEIETRMRPSPATRRFIIMAFMAGKGEVWFDDISVVSTEPEDDGDLITPWGAVTAPGSGLFEIRGAYKITGRRKSPKPTILIPLPLSYREQVPLTYELHTDPAEKLASVRIYRDRLDNYVSEVILMPLKSSERIGLCWSSIVLCASRSFDHMPKKAPFPENWPVKVRRWLRSSRCVQANHKDIQKVAREIRGDRQDVLEIVRTTLDRAGEICRNQEGRGTELDAVQALTKRGSCTSNANLMAALLRANGMPARILAGYPTNGVPLQTHYIVEVYVPDWGWYPIESSRLIAPWQPYLQIQVSTVAPEYEDRSGPRFWAMGGVPYLSLTEFPKYDGTFDVGGTISESTDCDHVARQWRKFPSEANAADVALVAERAKVRWRAWLKSSPSLDKDRRLATPLQADNIGAKNLAALAEVLAE